MTDDENLGFDELKRSLEKVLHGMREHREPGEEVIVQYFPPSGGVLDVSDVVLLGRGFLAMEGHNDRQQECVVYAPAFSVHLMVTKVKTDERVVGFNTKPGLLSGDDSANKDDTD